MGRFLEPDADEGVEKIPFNLNRYAYAHNNPYKFSDSDGNTPLLLLIVPELLSEITGIPVGKKAILTTIFKNGLKNGAKNVVTKSAGKKARNKPLNH